MKIFLSALRKPFAEYFVSQGLTHFKWNLMSYYGLKRDEADYIKAHSDEVMIDSGAHSFQFGKKVDWVEYTKEYAKFIESYDDNKVVGFFDLLLILLGSVFFLVYFLNFPISILNGFHKYIHIFFCHFATCEQCFNVG